MKLVKSTSPMVQFSTYVHAYIVDHMGAQNMVETLDSMVSSLAYPREIGRLTTWCCEVTVCMTKIWTLSRHLAKEWLQRADAFSCHVRRAHFPVLYVKRSSRSSKSEMLSLCRTVHILNMTVVERSRLYHAARNLLR